MTESATTPPAPEDPELVQTLRDQGPGRLVFGRFRLVRELGAGGMAVVWLAQDERLGLEVALKFLPGTVAKDPEALHDLRREITRGLRLTHAGIVRVYDLHEDSKEGLAAIAMEYVAGRTLSEEKARQPERCFDVAEPLLGWLRTLCDVLAYVHEQAKVVHRDLKPRNLMLTPEGYLKVADFGIAATISESHSRVTQGPGSSGTPVYMSPQQAAGNRPSVADDIYAVGAIIYELLTSKPPFFRGNIGLILHQAASEIAPAMRERREELGITTRAPIPPEWEETVAACLAKDPAARPPSIREVATRLGLAGNLPPYRPEVTAATMPTVRAVPVTPAPAAAPRRTAIVAGVALACLFLVVAAFIFWPKGRQDSAPPASNQPVAGEVPLAPAAPAAPGTPPAEPAAVDPATVVNRNARVIALGYEEINPAEFERQMEALQTRGISVITLQDFLTWRRGEASIPDQSCLITFERGRDSIYTQAWNILGRYSYPFTVFVVVNSIDTPGYLTWQQVRDMIDTGADIQNNSATYAALPELDPVALYHEVVDSSIALEAKLMNRVNAIAYPRGAYSPAVREMVVKSGLQAGFTATPGVITFDTPPDLLGRYLIGAKDGGAFEKAVKDISP